MNLLDYLTEKDIYLQLAATTKRKAIEELLDKLIQAKRVKKEKKKDLLAQLLAREKMGSTAIGNGIALPHVRVDNIKNIILGVGISAAGIEFDSLDSEPVYVVFLIISSQKEAGLHLKMLAHVAQLIKDKYFVKNLREAETPPDALRVIAKQQKFLV